MKKEMKYAVIGGQYGYFCYGLTPTLIGAKRLATKNIEYWDNWQGWHKPKIYRIEDTKEILIKESITLYDETLMRVPKYGAIPVE